MDTYLQGRYLLELWWLPQAKHFPVAELAPVSISTQPRAMFLLNFTGVTWGFKHAQTFPYVSLYEGNFASDLACTRAFTIFSCLIF